ncbi:MAG: glycosyltransferase family 2 protein [Arenicellales bacterium]
MKLLIVIPALNEEDAIRSIIERCLTARDEIVEKTNVAEVDVTVVSDGSTDATVAIAELFTESINLIIFPQNKGYGAAIQEAWRQSDADYLSFLDADGTCDPRFFTTLIKALEEEQADIALGCRLTDRSEMPALRRFGNEVFAMILRAFSSRNVRDTASGMRIIRRSSLRKLMPLPPGLNFTPAMSARAVLSDDITIVERDMEYKERIGDSKLRPLKDGIRFLWDIVRAALIYRPSRVLGFMAIFCVMIAIAIMIYPVVFYSQNMRVQEWMIYRFIVAELFGLSAVMMICAGYVGTRISNLMLGNRAHRTITAKIFRSRKFYLIPIVLTLSGSALVYGSVVDYLTTGQVIEHWSRFIVVSFLFSCAILLVITKILDNILELVRDRQSFLENY